MRTRFYRVGGLCSQDGLQGGGKGLILNVIRPRTFDLMCVLLDVLVRLIILNFYMLLYGCAPVRTGALAVSI